MDKKGKLELTWVGKNDEKELEPRILVEDKEKSYGDQDTGNMLIHGDNLLALKALEQEYTGKVKCIYIDPPYNTGSRINSDGETIGYEDGLEHSIWLNLIYSRMKLLNKLLSDDGLIFIQIDDNEQAYLKVLCDEVFGRENYLNTITVKTKAVAGASGGGEDKRLKKNCEYLLIYVKNYEHVKYQIPIEKVKLIDYIQDHKDNNVGFYYTRVITNYGKKQLLGTVELGNGEEMKVFKHIDFEFSSISKITKEQNLNEEEAYSKYFDSVFMVTNAQTSILGRVNDFVKQKNQLISYEYVPTTGRKKGQVETKYVWNETLVVWLRDSALLENGIPYKTQKMGTLWTNISWGRLDLEGGISFKNGKKPESLLKQIIDMSTVPGDIVLDSFLGSGTTIAAAHKMNRRWIGIELGSHVYSHCKKRIDGVIDGVDNSGITKELNWSGGGGYKFYELADPLLVKNKVLPIYQINPSYTWDMVSEAICKIEGFTYEPEGEFQGHSSENRYIHITQEYVNSKYVMSIMKNLGEKQSLLIYCKKFQAGVRLPENVEIKKIPKDLLDKCNFDEDSEVSE